MVICIGKKNALSLREDQYSLPGNDWQQYKCKVKLDKISGIEEAQLWEEEYLNASNTEAEDKISLTTSFVLVYRPPS